MLQWEVTMRFQNDLVDISFNVDAPQFIETNQNTYKIQKFLMFNEQLSAFSKSFQSSRRIKISTFNEIHVQNVDLVSSFYFEPPDPLEHNLVHYKKKTALDSQSCLRNEMKKGEAEEGECLKF